MKCSDPIGRVVCVLVAAIACLSIAQAAPLQLDIGDDGTQLKLVVRHPDIGLVCELWCYEGGPFRYGTATKRDDGRVVFVHTSGGMTATTTFTPKGPDRVLMDMVVEGPREELKKVNLVGPCMQFWHSEAFERRESLVDFAERCFIYTMRGPVGMLDTARGPMKSYKADAPENNPPWTQWYVPVEFNHPGDIWAFGASGDRPLYGVVGVASKDDRWISGIGCEHAKNVGQGWHDCIHHVVQMQKYFDDGSSRILHRSVIYVMANDKGRLLESFRQDFPDQPADRRIRVSAGKDGTLQVSPRSQKASPLDVSLKLDGTGERLQNWENSRWGGFVHTGSHSRMWAHVDGDSVQLYASLKSAAGDPKVEVVLDGKGWTRERSPSDVPAVVRRSADGKHIAAFMWETNKDGKPATAQSSASSGETLSVRGRLYLFEGDAETLRARWTDASQDWQHSIPYRMPVEESAQSGGKIRFLPNAEDDMTYGLTIASPWVNGGTLHINFPEHLEHGDVGSGILRHHDKRVNPWKIAPDGRSANYEIESLELPGVKVRATAVAHGDRARLSLKIANDSEKTLKSVKPLLCFWYAKLTGFPGKLSDNFEHTYVVMDGKPVTLASIPTENSDARAKVAYVRGCNQHDCDKFAKSRGGLIERDIDLGLIAVTDRDGKHKVVIRFTPGKSILSNRVIPCAHADPFFGTLAPGASAEATCDILFTEDPLDQIITTTASSDRK